MKKLIKKIIPASWLLLYHKALAYLGAVLYNFPSRKLKVIGVTGTNGKTTVCHMVRDILETDGFRVGMTTSIAFSDGAKDWENNTKQGMPGRLRLRKLLRQMLKNKCDYAIIETTSEGIGQFRHYKIDYNLAVFTNLTRDHIEAHGSFLEYRQAKEKLFEVVSKRDGGIAVLNLDDPNVEHFLKYNAPCTYGYSLKEKRDKDSLNLISADLEGLHAEGSVFSIQGVNYALAVPGEYNLYNALAAFSTCLSQGVTREKIGKALNNYIGIPGRLEEIKNKKGIRVFVDYAHTEDALENVYKTLRKMPHQRIVSVLGATGGGRDKKKRPILGRLAARYTDLVIITNEDPYNEDPGKIIAEVFAGVLKGGKQRDKNCWRILNRGRAIGFALSKSRPGDIVVITGKGCERVMAVGDKLIPWSDREEVKKQIKAGASKVAL